MGDDQEDRAPDEPAAGQWRPSGSALAELEAMLRPLREAEEARRRAEEGIREQAGVLCRYGEVEVARRLLELLPPPWPGLLGDVRVFDAGDAVRRHAETLRRHGRSDLARKILAALEPRQGSGAPTTYPYEEVEQLLGEFREIVARQKGRPSARAAALSLARREPWASQGSGADAIRDLLARHLKRVEAGLTLASFAQRVWDEAQEEKSRPGVL